MLSITRKYNTVICERQEVQEIKILLGRKQKSVLIQIIKNVLVRFYSIKNTTTQTFSTYFLARSNTVTASTCGVCGNMSTGSI